MIWFAGECLGLVGFRILAHCDTKGDAHRNAHTHADPHIAKGNPNTHAYRNANGNTSGVKFLFGLLFLRCVPPYTSALVWQINISRPLMAYRHGEGAP